MTYKPIAFSFAFVIGLGVVLGAGSAFSQTVTIKMGSFIPPRASPVFTNTQNWMKAVEKDSGGTLAFKEYWGGQLIRSPGKQYEAVLNKIQDVSIILPSLTQKLFPDFSLFSLPFLVRGAEEASIVSWRLYEKGLLRGLDKVYVAAIYSTDNSGLHFSKRIVSLAEIKGFKVRAAGPGESAVIMAMGAAPVGMRISQVAESLNRGVIQGTLTGWSAINTFRITRLIKTHVDLPFGVRSFFLGINKQVFDGLPDKAKQAIRKNSGFALSRKFGRAFDEADSRYRKEAVDDPKRNVLKFSPAQLNKQAAKLQFIHDRWIKKTADGQKKYDEAKKILAEIRKVR